MAVSISMFLAAVAIIVSTYALFSAKQVDAGGNDNLDEIMRIKQHINELHDKLSNLQKEHKELSERCKRLQEVSISADMQTLLNNAMKDYTAIANTSPEEGNRSRHEKKRKAAGEKVIKACNEVCERFITEDLSHTTFTSVYKDQLQSILNSEDLKEIYESVKSKYPYIARVLFFMSENNKKFIQPFAA